MHLFQIIMIIGTTTLVLVSALLFVVRKMPSRRGINWWLSATVTLSVSYFLATIFHDAEHTVIGDLIFYYLQIGANYAIGIGTLLFTGHTINLHLRTITLVATAAALTLGRINNLIFLADIVFAAYLSWNMLNIAFTLKRMPETNKAEKSTLIFCFFIGIHWLNYPFLKDVEWIAPIAFLIGISLGACFSLAVATMALLQFEKRTKESEQSAILASIKDPLTNLYNRAYLDKLFKKYISDTHRPNRAFVLMYIDLDGFKATNDTHGHSAGDFVLQTLAARMDSWLKGRGDIIRLGGG